MIAKHQAPCSNDIHAEEGGRKGEVPPFFTPQFGGHLLLHLVLITSIRCSLLGTLPHQTPWPKALPSFSASQTRVPQHRSHISLHLSPILATMSRQILPPQHTLPLCTDSPGSLFYLLSSGHPKWKPFKFLTRFFLMPYLASMPTVATLVKSFFHQFSAFLSPSRQATSDCYPRNGGNCLKKAQIRKSTVCKSKNSPGVTRTTSAP